jgi:hypothetical protein
VTETRFTPGPWWFARGYPNAYDVGAGDEVICALPTRSADGLVTQAQIDARLIAAAPEMYAALEAVLQECCLVQRHWGENANGRAATEAETAAHAALARARGEVTP